jgi:hypothetical protein
MVVVKAPVGANFTPIAAKKSTSGTMGSQLLSAAGDTVKEPAHLGTAAKSASVAWKITANGTSGTVTVTAFSDVAGSVVVTLCSAVARNAGGISSTISDVVAAINANTLFTGYYAVANNDTCSVFAPASLGAVTFNLTVTLTGDMTQGAGTVAGSYVLTLSPANLSVLRLGSGPRNVTGSVTAATSGGTGTSTFAWSENTSGSGNGINLSSATGATVTFSKNLAVGTSVTGTFKCVATDGGSGSVTTVVFTVTLELDSNS